VLDLTRNVFESLRRDEEFVLYRGRNIDDASQILLLAPATATPSPIILRRLENEYSLRAELDPAWSARPMAVAQHMDRTVLALEDPGGVPLDQSLGQPLDFGFSLRVVISLFNAIRHVHRRGIVHKDIKPANVLVNSMTGQVWLMGFGIASRLPRERKAPEPPEFLEGTLAYMAPEQTGRMNRSVDSRSDFYSMGVTLYQMLTGSLPFAAGDPTEWVHSHIARKPVSPIERLEHVPAAVSAIIMKLLAKTAEERYQTAAAVESDLRRCLAEWERSSAGALPGRLGATKSCQIEEFPLGENDTSDRLLIPEKLYGRAAETEILLSSFDRAVAGGAPELVLVCGYSGIGKSSVVNELQKVLVLTHGLFASGKFDQYKRDIPYATLAQAFQGLIRFLLGKSDTELQNWRRAFNEALGTNGQLMVDLVPELKLIIGEQPPLPTLPPQEAQGRFQMVFRRFISVFARPEHPLALFLDDLQWLDAATFDLIEDLLTSDFADNEGPEPKEPGTSTNSTGPLPRTRHTGMKHLLLIGAYRDNEVSVSHPLMRKLELIRRAGALVWQIRLSPLAQDDLEGLIADALHCSRDRAAPLARLVQEKTGGNPFFAIQFISALAQEDLLTFDHSVGQWTWDLARIHAKGYTDNVVDLMVDKLNRLPVETQTILKEFACLGNAAETKTLSIVHGTSEEAVQSDLWEALRLEFVVGLDGSYRFVHDRIQEAAYSLIPEELRAEAHLRMGRLLKANTASERLEEAVFEIVNQLNRGARLISSRDEREQLAGLNLLAGKRARASTAYTSALKYFSAGVALLADDCWERRHELIFPLEYHRAECEFLTGQLAAVEERLTLLSSRAADTVEQASVACLRVDLYTTLNQSDRAVAVCVDYLRHLGVEWSPHPTKEETRREYEGIWLKLGNRAIEELIDLPLMSDPASLATMDVLTKVVPPALFTDANFLSLAICRAVNLSLERGNSDGASFLYVWLGIIAGPHFGNYNAGFRFGQLGYDLVEKCGLKRFQARTYACFGYDVMPWSKHFRVCRPLLRRAFDAANASGDLTFAAYSCNNLNSNSLAVGDPLAEAQREAEHGLEFAQKAGFGHVIDLIGPQLGLMRTLRGLTPKFGSFDDSRFDEVRFERHLASEPVLALPECWYYTRKLQARFFAGDYAGAAAASLRAQRVLSTITASLFEIAEYHFYSALARAALCDTKSRQAGYEDSLSPVAPSDRDASSRSASQASRAPEEDRRRRKDDEDENEAGRAHFKALLEHHKQLALWAENCPENFENRAALVSAEIARIQGRELDAERLYEAAIRSARANGFIHNEALANELAAGFYWARGFEKIADAYLRDARYCYLRWGATAKVRQLEELFPQLREEGPTLLPTSTIGSSIEHLDLATVIKVSQTVSGEIVLEKLIDTLMRTAIEHAGAERGLLILPRDIDQSIEAEAMTSGDTIIVRSRQAPITESEAPESIINYVVRTRESVILDDAASQHAFSADRYLRRNRARSILCLPLINQAKLIGLLYLENNLAPHVFTSTRITVLKLLASQAAISLENTRLYRDLEKREAKIRRLVDANIMGIFISNFEGQIFEANEAFLRMVDYSREDLLAGGLNWKELTPPEWRDLTERRIMQLKATGTLQAHEKEYFRRDGSRVPVLVGTALFEEGQDEGVSFVLDLSEKKRAEEALRRSEAYLAEAQKLSNTGSFGWNVSNGRIYWSQETYRIFGYDSGTEPIIERVVDRTHPEDRALVQAVIDRVTQDRQEFDLDHRLLMPDGSVKYLRVVGRLSKEGGSDNSEFVGAVTDITERKRSEEALQRAQAELAHVSRVMTVGQLSASIAHEMNQPLSAMVTNANAGLRWLTGDSPDLEEASQAIQRIIRDGQRASAVVGRMHALFKKAPSTKEQVDINEVIQEVLGLSQGEIRSNRISLWTRLANDLPLVMGDRVQFQQVILNLVLNAIQAMSGEMQGAREMEVSSEKKPAKLNGPKPDDHEQSNLANVQSSHLLITVQDSGPGLDLQLVNRLFEAFYTTKPQGLGIGLAISRSIIEAHGGKLWAEPNPRGGAIFQFTLPI
jgi:PAS domain S-box-containing protein